MVSFSTRITTATNYPTTSINVATANVGTPSVDSTIVVKTAQTYSAKVPSNASGASGASGASDATGATGASGSTGASDATGATGASGSTGVSSSSGNTQSINASVETPSGFYSIPKTNTTGAPHGSIYINGAPPSTLYVYQAPTTITGGDIMTASGVPTGSLDPLNALQQAMSHAKDLRSKIEETIASFRTQYTKVIKDYLAQVCTEDELTRKLFWNRDKLKPGQSLEHTETDFRYTPLPTYDYTFNAKELSFEGSVALTGITFTCTGPNQYSYAGTFSYNDPSIPDDTTLALLLHPELEYLIGDL